MLTPNPNQYLRPEYLSPLPTTLDAKKSPLALLAQTCSNIGMDTSPHGAKSVLSSHSSADRRKRDRTSAGSSAEKERTKEKQDGSPVTVSSLGQSVDVVGDKNSEKDEIKSSESTPRLSFKPYENTSRKSPPGSPGRCEELRTSTPRSPALSDRSANGNERNSRGGQTPSSDASASSTSSVYPIFSTAGGSSAPSISLTTTLSSLGYGLPSQSLDKDVLGFPPSMSHLSLAYRGLSPSLPPLSLPYFPGYLAGYRPKPPPGTPHIPALCRDPFCSSGCLSGLSGATDRLLPLSSSLPLLPLPTVPFSMNRPHTSSGNICSWAVGDSFCGKRFNSSEELLEHLRTHASTITSSLGDNSLLHPALSYSIPSTLASSLPMRPNSLNSTRFHPYGKTSSGSTSSTSSGSSSTPTSPSTSLPSPLPTLPTPPLVPLSSISSSQISPSSSLMFYTPYSIYGQRLGPPVQP